jgi:cytoskeletal protein CcmA (bactofilin family)
MFKKREADIYEFDTLIGTNTYFEGNIKSEGTIRVDGKVKGDITTDGDVLVGTSAVVTGSIFANNVHLSGKVEGNIQSKGLLRILSTAKLYGDIQVHSFVADEGGFFQGKCSMVEVPEAETKASSAPIRKNSSSKDYKKSSVLINEEQDKSLDINK